jgi:hypothetical protein
MVDRIAYSVRKIADIHPPHKQFAHFALVYHPLPYLLQLVTASTVLERVVFVLFFVLFQDVLIAPTIGRMQHADPLLAVTEDGTEDSPMSKRQRLV